MEKSFAQTRLLKLRAQIEDLRTRYHVHNDPSVTDDVYESLLREMKDLEALFPELSESQLFDRVAGAPLPFFTKVTHVNRMLSLNDAFSIDEMVKWSERMEKLLGGAPHHYFGELKLDGLAITLRYEDGVLVQAATRGDGFVGEDVTSNARVVKTIPLLIKHAPRVLEVRGEVIMRKAVLEKLNKKQLADGKQPFANTRNAAAGSIRQLDPVLAQARELDFFAYDISQMEGMSMPQTHSAKHELLRLWGFPVPAFDMKVASVTELTTLIDEVAHKRDSLPFHIDGIVVCVDELELQDELGIVGKAPRYAIAFKYPAERATTTVTAITVQVGRTGVLTPLAHFIPTLVAGSTVSKATLHNIDQVKRLDIKIGDTVVIQKAGDVIPEVVEVLKDMRTGSETSFSMPAHCPVCNAAVATRESATKAKGNGSTVAYYCTSDDCPAKHTRGMIHFVHVLDIYEVGPKIIDRLQEEGLITDAADLFALTEADLAGLERMGEKSAKNIVDAIAAKKYPPLDRFIASLGIQHVGEETARDIALHFGSFEKFWSAPSDALDAIPNIGPAVTESIDAYKTKESSKRFVEKLFANGVQPKELQKVTTGVFAGKTFVLTGTLPTLDRNDAKKLIQSHGGKVSSSVSKSTSYVLVGENPGSKFDEAQKLGVEIIEEEAFLKMAGSLL